MPAVDAISPVTKGGTTVQEVADNVGQRRRTSIAPREGC